MIKKKIIITIYIGEGGFAKVFLAENTKEGKKYAIKGFNKEKVWVKQIFDLEKQKKIFIENFVKIIYLSHPP